MTEPTIKVELRREEAQALGAFSDAFQALANEHPELREHVALPHLKAAALKLRQALSERSST